MQSLVSFLMNCLIDGYFSINLRYAIIYIPHMFINEIQITENHSFLSNLSGFATLMTALIALYSAWQSAKSASESKKAAQANHLPIVVPEDFTIESNRGPERVVVKLKNVGTGIAQHITITIADFNITNNHVPPITNNTFYYYKSGDDQMFKKKIKAGERSLLMEIYFSDVFGNKFKTTATYSFKETGNLAAKIQEWGLHYL